MGLTAPLGKEAWTEELFRLSFLDDAVVPEVASAGWFVLGMWLGFRCEWNGAGGRNRGRGGELLDDVWTIPARLRVTRVARHELAERGVANAQSRRVPAEDYGEWQALRDLGSNGFQQSQECNASRTPRWF